MGDAWRSMSAAAARAGRAGVAEVLAAEGVQGHRLAGEGAAAAAGGRRAAVAAGAVLVPCTVQRALPRP